MRGSGVHKAVRSRPFLVDRRALTLGVVVALLITAAAWGKKAEDATDYETLRAALAAQSDEDQRARLAQFAREDRVALSDRLLAVSAWRRLLDNDAPQHVDIDLYEAHLRALGNAQGLRDKALLRASKGLRELLDKLDDELKKAEQAKAARKANKREKKRKKGKTGKNKGATKRNKPDRPRKIKVIKRDIEETSARLEHVEAARVGDEALTKLRRAIRDRAKASRRTAADASEAALVTKLTDALPHYKTLGDERQHAEAQLGLALFLEYSDAARPDVDRALARLVRVGGSGRDLARVRQKVRRARARVLEELGDIKAAVHESLVADRTVKVPLQKAAFELPPPAAYQRSRATAELCWRAFARGVRCAELEEERSGSLTFYDYSQERRPGFDDERARMVLAEYEPLLLGCLSEAASKGNSVSNTTVQLEWSIELDGHVRSFSVNPRRLRGGPLESCFRGAFDRFRYPRYQGEMQHTQLSFNVGG
jgi:hypothetical protein